ncbi:MAG: N-acetylneuraminate synthase family protein [Acidimicrobiales bacterium]|nr:N-acetylneuraminate synthase family protein [Acidimicrobiales bacterium]
MPRIIERHLTLDRSLEGSDHKASLLPHEYASLVEDVRDVDMAIGSRAPRSLSQGEMLNREILSKSLVASVGYHSGRRSGGRMIESPQPGTRPSAKSSAKLVGRRAVRAMRR